MNLITAPSKTHQVAEYLRNEIESGRIRSGAKLGGIRSLANQFSVSMQVIISAFDLLETENLIIRRKRQGTFVNNINNFKKKKGTVQFVSYDLKNIFYSPFSNKVYKGVKEVFLKQKKYNLEFKEIDKDFIDIPAYISSLDKDDLAGIILTGVFERDFILKCAEKTPIVLTGKILEGSVVPAVTPDNYNIMKTALDYLFKLGHRKIVYLPSNLTHVGYVEKLEAYKKLFTEFSRKYGSNSQPMFKLGEYQSAAGKILKYSPTAIIICGDTGISDTLKVLKKHNLRVPEDISLMALDDNGLASMSNPPVTVIDVHTREIGRKAAELLTKIFESGKATSRRINVSGDLVIRESANPLKID